MPHDLDEPPLDEVIRSMAIGDIRPVEASDHQVERTADIPLFPYIARGAGNQNPKDNGRQNEDEGEPQNEENAFPEGQANPEGNANHEGNVEPQGNEIAHPRVRRRVDADMILESISQLGHPTTRSRTRLANLCGNFSFVSMIEP